MKVRAKSKGFYLGRIVYADEVFDVPEGMQAEWFDVLDVQPSKPQKLKDQCKGGKECKGCKKCKTAK